MRRSHIHIIIIALGFALLATASCIRGIEPEDRLSEGITFAPEVTSTKGLLDAVDLPHAGTKIRVYDYISGFDGEVGGNTVTSGQTVKYFDDRITYDSTVATYWPYCNSSTGAPDASVAYPWTKSGTHTFFGWLDADGAASPALTAASLFGTGQPTLNESTRVLSIPETAMDATAAQFDFSYASPVAVDAATRTAGTPVPLQLQHLFSAFKVTVSNTSGNTILLKSVTFKGMKNNRSATIDFSTSPATVTTTLAAEPVVDVPLFAHEPTPSAPDGLEIADSSADPDHAEQDILMSDFLLMWPQLFNDLATPVGNRARMDVFYHIKDANDVVSDELAASVILSNQNIFKTNSDGMDAGKKYVFMLQFKQSTIDLTVSVLPWEYEEYDWDYSDHTISARAVDGSHDGVLVFYRGEGDSAVGPTAEEWSAKTMRFTTRNEVITGRFYIEAPTQGRWQVTAYPMSAAENFIISPTSGDIDLLNDPTGQGKTEFTVRINPASTANSTQTLYFNISMYFNGDWHDANSEFNRKNIKLIWEP